MAAHKHAEIIKAWADGAEIEIYQHWSPCGWRLEQYPVWSEDCDFRIKPTAPEVEYPVTWMTPDELYAVCCTTGALTDVANAALRHAIDSQQVIRMAEVQEIASQLGKDKRAARDMAVAKAVMGYFHSFASVKIHPDLRLIIADVK